MSKIDCWRSNWDWSSFSGVSLVLALDLRGGAFVPRPYPGHQSSAIGIHYGSGPRHRHHPAPGAHVVSQNVSTLYSQPSMPPAAAEILVLFPPVSSMRIDPTTAGGCGENMKCAHLWVFYNKTIWGNRRTASEPLSSILGTSSSLSTINADQDTKKLFKITEAEVDRHWWQIHERSNHLVVVFWSIKRATQTCCSKLRISIQKQKTKEIANLEYTQSWASRSIRNFGPHLQRWHQDLEKWSRCSDKLVSPLWESWKHHLWRRPLRSCNHCLWRWPACQQSCFNICHFDLNWGACCREHGWVKSENSCIEFCASHIFEFFGLFVWLNSHHERAFGLKEKKCLSNEY